MRLNDKKKFKIPQNFLCLGQKEGEIILIAKKKKMVCFTKNLRKQNDFQWNETFDR